MLLMIIMRKVAEKHQLKVIFHEKPFDGVNGSGKHVNWSLVTDNGNNLLLPGDDLQNNQCFWAFYSSIVRAVHRHHLLLMTSVSSLSNSYRLGGHEAPPSIMSISSGSVIYNMINCIINGGDVVGRNSVSSLRVAESMPDIQTDDTDRNRTSPFAFIGNRFEFRALGASMNATAATYILNSIVAESLNALVESVDKYRQSGDAENVAVNKTIREFLKESRNILFEGDGYSQEWVEEARRRGLKGVTDVPEAFDIYIAPQTAAMYKSLGVLTQKEIDARYEVVNESYVKKLQIEARTLTDICMNIILPASISYLNVLTYNLEGASKLFGADAANISRASREIYLIISELNNSILDQVNELSSKRREANKIASLPDRAKAYSKVIKPLVDSIRNDVDKLEEIVDDAWWPLPKYRELMSIN